MSEPLELTGAVEMIGPMSVDSIDQKELAERLLERAMEQNVPHPPPTEPKIEYVLAVEG